MQVAKALSNLAALLDASENVAEAEIIYHRSLSIREDSLGEDNIEVQSIHIRDWRGNLLVSSRVMAYTLQVAAGFRELAELLRKQCTFDIAESHARQSCAAFQSLKGQTSADALQTQCLIMCILRDTGR